MLKWKSQWHNKGECEGMPEDVLVRMKMLRRQLLLHAYIYYALNDNIISDHEWDKRGKEHKALQDQHGWNIDFYDDIFKNYNGQSAYWFPTNRGIDEDVDRVARRILSYDKKIAAYPDAVKTETGHRSLLWSQELKEKGL